MKQVNLRIYRMILIFTCFMHSKFKVYNIENYKLKILNA